MTNSAGEREEERRTGLTGDGHGRVLYHQPPSRQSRGGILAMFWVFGLCLILVSQVARLALSLFHNPAPLGQQLPDVFVVFISLPFCAVCVVVFLEFLSGLLEGWCERELTVFADGSVLFRFHPGRGAPVRTCRVAREDMLVHGCDSVDMGEWLDFWYYINVAKHGRVTLGLEGARQVEPFYAALGVPVPQPVVVETRPLDSLFWTEMHRGPGFRRLWSGPWGWAKGLVRS